MELYIHVPFCLKKCGYCDFYSVVADRKAQRAYFDEVLTEIEEADREGEEVTTVFFGGGTPSSADPEEIGRVTEALKRKYRIREDAEITLEANPGTLNREKLVTYRSMGINRLSMGLQSTEDRLLEKIGRIHDYETFRENFQAARETGFDNISVDLISGLPTLERKTFLKSLEKLVDLSPEHISVYSLIIAENTPFYALYGESGQFSDQLPTDDEDREMVADTKAFLTSSGYRQYEISNYARPGFESRHNTGYWTGEEYLGFGAGAASFLYTEKPFCRAVRFKNAEKLDYRKHSRIEEEFLGREDLKREFLMLGLRMKTGVSKREYRRRFLSSLEDDFGEIFGKYEAYGVLRNAGDRLQLTEYGEDVCNLLFEDILCGM